MTESLEIKNLRYSRHLKLDGFTQQSQTELNAASVLIMGVGGLGTIASLYLANSGIGNIIVNDYDSVDLTNLPRQILFNSDDLGNNKAETAKKKLLTFNPNIAVEAITEKLKENQLEKKTLNVDVVLDCTDNLQSRLLINKVCIKNKKSLISGAAIRYEGHIAVFRNDIAIKNCYNCLYQQEDENLEDCEGSGILAPVAGLVGVVMATETIKILIGQESILDNRLWVLDSKNNTNKIIKIQKSKTCMECDL
jgi:molybdopterin/thiamine biosynthesis adenylyltransferase